MAEPPGLTYKAIRVIDDPNGARAYNEGDLVHEAAVEGPAAWLKVGDDVELREGASPSRPAKSASHALWAQFAAAQPGGPSLEDAESMSRKDLIAAYGEEAS